MKVIIRSAMVLATICAAVESANALTGAQLKSQPRSYAVGYLWGALNAHLFIADGEAAPIQTRRTVCIQESGMTDQAFADAVLAFIDQDASLLRQHSNAALIRALIEMCD